MTAAEELARAWLEDDRRRARDPREAAALAASSAARHWIAELWLEQGGISHDGSSGFAQLGRVLAAEQVSGATALESVTSFGRRVAASAEDLATARSALVDAYTEARVEQERAAARARFAESWIELGDGHGAVVAEPPDDDLEWLRDWADRTAAGLLRRKVRRVLVKLPEPARAALAASLELVGIEIVTTRPAPATGARGFWRWFRR